MQHDVCQKRSSVIFCQMIILNPFDDDAVTRKMVEEFVEAEEEHCSCVCDPQKGDPIHGIDPGTEFEDFPEDWKCPRCRKGKDQFRSI
jgi:rubredoxin